MVAGGVEKAEKNPTEDVSAVSTAAGGAENVEKGPMEDVLAVGGTEGNIAKVAERWSEGIFPCVMPDDYNDKTLKDEGEYFKEYQRHCDYVGLKSFLEVKKAEFMSTTPFDEGVPQKVREAKFNYLCYYRLSRRYYLEKSLTERMFAHRMENNRFLPVIGMASLRDREVAVEGQSILEKVKQYHIAEIDKTLWAQYDAMANLRGDDLAGDAAVDSFISFVEAAYIPVIKKVVETMKEPLHVVGEGFEAAYPVEILGADAETQRARKDLLKNALPEDADKLDVRLQMKFAESVEKVPLELRGLIPADAGEKFRRKYYFDELAVIIRERSKNVRVPVHVRADAAEMIAREELLKRLNNNDLKKVEEKVVEEYEESLKAVPDEVRHLLDKVPPKSYWENMYYPTMFYMFPKGGRAVSSAQSLGSGAVAQCTRALPVGEGSGGISGKDASFRAQPVADDSAVIIGMDALLGGGNYVDEAIEQDVEVKWFGSARMIAEDIPGAQNKFEGWLIECDDVARTVEYKQGTSSPGKRSGDSATSTTAVDCLLADKHGPVVGCMWEEAGAALLRIRNGTSSSASKALVCFETVRIVTLKETKGSGKMLTPLRVMHSVRPVGVQAGTKISLSERPTSPYTMAGAFSLPSAACVISHFNRHRAALSAPPCRGNFHGMIDNVQDLDTTQLGKPKLQFELVDGEGTAITVFAIARNANRSIVKAHVEVAIFNGTVRAGLGGSLGGLYLFKDAMIVPMGMKKPPTTKCRVIDMRAISKRVLRGVFPDIL